MDKDIRKYHNLFLRGVDNIGRVKLNVNDGAELPVAQLPVHGIDKIEDMSVASPANGEALVYNSTTGKWENNTIAVGETNTASSVGATGVGVFKQKSGVDLEFRTVGAGSNKVTVTDASDVITVDVDAANVEAAIIGGADTQVQFNDSDVFNGDSGLVYDKTNANLKPKKMNSVRMTSQFTDFEDCIQNDTGSAVAGKIEGTPGETVTWANKEQINGASSTDIILPRSFKIDYSLTDTVTNKGFLTFSSKTDIRIEGGEWDGNALNNTYHTEHTHALSFDSCSRVVVKNAYFHDWAGDCIYLRDCEDVLIEGCTFYNPNVNGSAPLIGRNCLAIVNGAAGTNTRNIRVIGCTFYGGNPAGLDIEPNGAGECRDIIIDGCRFYGEGSYRGIACEPASGREALYVTISNCIIRNYAYGITMAGAGTTRAISIENVTIQGSATNGIWGSNAEGVDVKNCQILDTTGQGILFTTNNSDLRFSDCLLYGNSNAGIGLAGTSGNENNDVTIQGCKFHNNSFGNIGTYPQIEAARTDNLWVLGNEFVDDQGTPTANYPARIQYCAKGFYNGNNSQGHTTNNEPYLNSNTNFVRGLNYVNTLAILQLSETVFNSSSIASASTPANFSANRIITWADSAGNTFYIPAGTVTW